MVLPIHFIQGLKELTILVFVKVSSNLVFFKSSDFEHSFSLVLFSFTFNSSEEGDSKVAYNSQVKSLAGILTENKDYSVYNNLIEEILFADRYFYVL